MFPLLDTLVAVYEIGQFTLAADELKVSQSTVSSRIAQLERMVGGAAVRPQCQKRCDADRGWAVAVPCGDRHRWHVARRLRADRPHAREP